MTLAILPRDRLKAKDLKIQLDIQDNRFALFPNLTNQVESLNKKY
ncbi:MAG: hypothetical protein AB4206_10070 [Xenococcaceae cyanobacterium]